MLGEKIGDFKGKVTGKRVLSSNDGRPKVETSFEVTGKILGADTTMMGTYWSTVKTDGTIYGECPGQGVIMTTDGGTGTWTGAGAGRFTGNGSAVSFRGAIYFPTTPQKLSRLGTIAAVYEWDVDADGNAQASFWEWK